MPVSVLLLLALLIFANPASAAETPGLAGTLTQMLLGLGLVLALMLGALFLIRKLSLPRGPAAASLRVVGAAAVGPRERVVLVEVGNKILVLGVAPGQVEGLHTFERADFPADSALQGQSPADGSFAARLHQMLEKRR